MLVNFKNIGHIYYPRNWDDFLTTNYILVENEFTREINYYFFNKSKWDILRPTTYPSGTRCAKEDCQ